MSKSRAIALSVGVLVVVGAGMALLAKRLAQHEASAQADLSPRPSVTNTRPAGGQEGVSPLTGVIAEVELPNPAAGVNPNLLAASVQLFRTRDKKIVPVHTNTTGSGDAIILKPIDRLELNTQYTFRVTDQLADTSGAKFVPFESTFTTAADFKVDQFPAAFEQVAMPDVQLDRDAFLSLAIGPDGMLYAGSFAGMIYRYAIAPDGALSPREPVMTILQANGGPRLITGIAFDPASTKEQPILWVNHGQMAVSPTGKPEGADDWTGKLSRLTGANLENNQDVLIHLPRAYKDHLNFQMTFGRDGAIYFTQGSHTSVGDVDKKWNYRPERKLSAAVLRLDPNRLPEQLPVDVKTDEGGTYDPSGPGAPLTLHATGVRSGFDLLLHTNGHLYCGVNGAAGNEGNTPASPDGKVPAIRDLKQTTDDVLLKIEPGRYYGHPNPTRGQFVLNGGNPTAGPDAMEVDEYPVGVQPDPNLALPAFNFGKNFSPNGLIEYRSRRFDGALAGAILVTRYSDGKDILVLRLNAEGDVTETIAGLDGFTGFEAPLDLVEDRATGNLYVADYGGRRIILLRPLDRPSEQAQVTKVR